MPPADDRLPPALQDPPLDYEARPASRRSDCKGTILIERVFEAGYVVPPLRKSARTALRTDLELTDFVDLDNPPPDFCVGGKRQT